MSEDIFLRLLGESIQSLQNGLTRPEDDGLLCVGDVWSGGMAMLGCRGLEVT